MKRDPRTISRRWMIAGALAAGVVTPISSVRAADAAAAPATQPAYPTLDQINRECISLSRELQGSLLRVQVPAPRVASNNFENDARWNRYNGRLNPDVKKALQQRAVAQQQYGANGGNYNNVTTQPTNASNAVLNNAVQNSSRGNASDQPPQQQQQAEPRQNPSQGQSPAQNAGQPNSSGNGNNDSQQLEQNGRQQGLTIIVPVTGNTVNPDVQQLQIGNDLRNGANNNYKAGPALIANNVGLLIDEHKGYVLVPAYMDREMLEQPVRLAIGDGEPIEAQLVGSDQQTQLTVLQLLPPGTAHNEPQPNAPAGNGQQPAQQQIAQQPAQPAPAPAQAAQRASRDVSRRPLDEVISGLGKPVRLSNRPLLDGSLVIVFSVGDSTGRLMVWSGPSKEPSVVVGIDGEIAGVSSRGGQFLSGAHCRLIAEQIIRHGSVKRATLGVIISQVPADDPDRQRIAELADKPAVRVDEIMKGSVAEKGGLKQGDLILSVAGETVHDIPSLAAAIAARNGRTKLSVLREGKVIGVAVELTQRN